MLILHISAFTGRHVLASKKIPWNSTEVEGIRCVHCVTAILDVLRCSIPQGRRSMTTTCVKLNKRVRVVDMDRKQKIYVMKFQRGVGRYNDYTIGTTRE